MAKNGRKAQRASLYRRNDLETKKRETLHEKIKEFELFDKTLMPKLRKMVLENWSPDKIRRAFAPLIQARMIQAGLSGHIQAMKDTLDRNEGTAVQRQETLTRYAKMDKQELAALALQKLTDAGIIDVTGRRIKSAKKETSDT